MPASAHSSINISLFLIHTVLTILQIACHGMTNYSGGQGEFWCQVIEVAPLQTASCQCGSYEKSSEDHRTNTVIYVVYVSASLKI